MTKNDLNKIEGFGNHLDLDKMLENQKDPLKIFDSFFKNLEKDKMEKDNKTPKDKIQEQFPNLTETQLMKLTEAYFTLNWINPGVNISKYLVILKGNQAILV